MVTKTQAKRNDLVRVNFVNRAAFQRQLKELAKITDDLRFPLGEIARDFYKSEKAIFQLKSAGGYPVMGGFKPNAPSGFGSQSRRVRAETLKEQAGFSIYPLLKRTGKLEKSITTPNSEGSLLVINRMNAIIGSTLDYAAFANSDKQPRRKIPLRKYIFIGPESREFGHKRIFGGRPLRWKLILEKYMERKQKAAGF